MEREPDSVTLHGWKDDGRKEPDVVHCPHKPSVPTHCCATSSDFPLLWFCILEHAAPGVPFTRQWPLSASSFMPFFVTDKWERFRRDILLFFLSLSCTVQALDRRSSRKRVCKVVHSRQFLSHKGGKTNIPKETKSCQRPLRQMQCLFFESVSQTAASVPETGCVMLHPRH